MNNNYLIFGLLIVVLLILCYLSPKSESFITDVFVPQHGMKRILYGPGFSANILPRMNQAVSSSQINDPYVV